MCAMISGLFIGSNDGRPPQAYKENIVSLIQLIIHIKTVNSQNFRLKVLLLLFQNQAKIIRFWKTGDQLVCLMLIIKLQLRR